MSEQRKLRWSPDRPWPVLGPDDPLFDFSRENAAYMKEAERLARDHLGKIALVYQDAVVGVFNDPDEAYEEATRRFGLGAVVMVREIRDPKGPLDYVSSVDVNHPSSTPVDFKPSGPYG